MYWMLEASKMEAKKIISYRVDFWLQFIATVVTEIAVAYFLWDSVYGENRQQKIGGYDFNQMFLYSIFMPFVGRIVRSQDDFSTAREIYEGALNKYLVLPVSFIGYKVMQKFIYSILTVLQMMFGLLLIGQALNIDLPFNLLHFGLGIISALSAMLLYAAMSFCLEIIAFWAETVWSLSVMMRFIAMFLGGALIPINLFPEWSRVALDLTPFPYLFFHPIRIFLGEMSANQAMLNILITLLWAVPFFILLDRIFKKGLKQYSGIGM